MKIKVNIIRFCFFAGLAGLINACNENTQSKYAGYLDADLKYLSSDYSGRLINLKISRGDSVRPGQVLFELEQQNELYDVNTSIQSVKTLQAQLHQLKQELHYARVNFERYQALNKEGFATTDMVDERHKNLLVIEAKINATQSEIQSQNVVTKQKQWKLSRKENIASESGVVFDTYFSNDEYIDGGKPILSLVTESNIKTIFYVPETDLAKLKINQTVNLSLDGRESYILGKVKYIASKAEFTMPQVYTPEQRNKLVYRVEAKLINPELSKLHLGQPVTVKVVNDV